MRRIGKRRQRCGRVLRTTGTAALPPFRTASAGPSDGPASLRPGFLAGRAPAPPQRTHL